MTVLYVVSDREGAGKTALCATLASKLAGMDKKVALLKPVAASGLDAGDDPDPASYAGLLGIPTDGWPFGKGEGPLGDDIEGRTKAEVDRMSSVADIVIVEGSTALTPEEHRRLADTLDAKVLAVVAYNPDIPSDDLASWLSRLGDRAVGAVVNGSTRHRGREAGAALKPSMCPNGVTTYGVVPEDRRLLGVCVGQLSQHLDGRFMSGEDASDGLVEHLMVGGRGMDPGEHYFGVRDSKAVIVRGDRPDVQMAALTTSTACMVMTKGIEPIEYVQYEAREEGVPVIVVETDTIETMEALNGLMDSARFDHPLKLARYSELADEHIDLPALYGALDIAV
mgnify:CR=1 FL=1